MRTIRTMRQLSFMVSVALLGCGGSGASSGTGGNGGTGTGAGGTSAAGSSGGGTTGGGGNSAGANSFEPMSVGATWSYATTVTGDGGTVSGTKVVTVEASEPVPGRAGITAWRTHTVVPSAEDQLTWQAETSTAIVRHRDEVYATGSVTSTGLLSVSSYAQFKLRIDVTPANLATGATYTESFTETVMDATGTSSSSKPFAWKVINGAESITVPAGTFTAVHLQKSNGNSGAIDKDYWFALGVGKVKETSNAGRTELLTTYHIP